MKIGVLFAHTESARFLSARLLETFYDVCLFLPDKFDVDMAENIIAELKILGKEQDLLSKKEKSFTVMRFKDMADCQAVGKTKTLL